MAEFAIQLRMFPLFLILLRFLQQLIQNCHLRISTESFELSDDDGAPGEVDSEAESITHAATANQDNATIRVAGVPFNLKQLAAHKVPSLWHSGDHFGEERMCICVTKRHTVQSCIFVVDGEICGHCSQDKRNWQARTGRTGQA